MSLSDADTKPPRNKNSLCIGKKFYFYLRIVGKSSFALALTLTVVRINSGIPRHRIWDVLVRQM